MNPTQKSTTAVDLGELRRRLASETGPRYWRGLEEAAGSEEFRAAVEREFPSGATVFTDPVGRRRFLSLMGASLALAGVTGCTKQPKEYIHPYAAEPPEQLPGKPRFFATVMPSSGAGEPLLVESHENRPTKIEGNPEHPASRGATSVFAQAEILQMYDPDRFRSVIQRGRSSSWTAFEREFAARVGSQRIERGARLRVLMSSSSSPTLGDLLERVEAAYPEAKIHQWEPAGRDAARAAAVRAFGEPVSVRYRPANAKVILSLDADFLSTNGPGGVEMVREFADGRKVADGDVSGMNRLYVVEPNATVTGSNADHRLRLKASEVEAFAPALAAALGVDAGVAAPSLSERAAAWIEPLAADLRAAGAAALVIPGDQQPASVHVAAHAINAALGAAGSTVVYSDPLEIRPVDQTASLGELVVAMNRGDVEVLIILGGNPVYDAPADWEFAKALDNVDFRVYSGHSPNETSELCHWQLPGTHFLEAWGDARTIDGTVSIQQPLIAPLYDGRSELEVLSLLLEGAPRTGYDIVRGHWSARLGLTGDEFEKAWRRALHDGYWAGTAPPERTIALAEGWSAGLTAPSPTDGLELVIRPDATIHDGRYNNNGWLQELPKPILKTTWENVFQVSPATAAGRGLSAGDVVDVTAGERRLRGPVWIVPGHADDAVTATLGYGRRKTGRVGEGAGFDVYAARTSDRPWVVPNVEIVRVNRRVEVACVQDHWSMEGRGLIQIADAETYAEHPDFAQAGHHGEAAHAEAPGVGAPFVGKVGPEDDARRQGAGLFQKGRGQGISVSETSDPKSLYPEWNYTGRAWGMAIDLNACVGCNACTIACQSENNIAVVGKEQVALGREMHWIRLDRYFEGSVDDPQVVSQPVPCMQCENAPCEPVCPVGATVHSNEGLNDMVYNRCVGTRYCSNNCPYKVRRFNFLLYSDFETDSLKPMRNPDVTIRSRGVMEKCTYCVQRINAARIDADRANGGKIADGEIETACQQACPAEAIIFGDINDPESRVVKAKKDSRNYGLLVELNTQPRTTYLARVRNPNPAMPAVSHSPDEAHS